MSSPGRLADACYRALVLALAADVRRDFEDDMVQLFRDQRRAVAGRPARLLALWAGAIADLVVDGRPDRQARDVARPGVSMETLMRTFFSDLRQGLRLLRRYPATSIIAVATLALGIGANTAIFTVVDSVLLRQVPYPDPDRLVVAWETRPKEGVSNNVVAPGDLRDWRQRSSSFQALAGFTEVGVSLTGIGDPVQLDAAAVSWGFFDVLGVKPELGRLFQPGDEVFGQHRVVVLSHAIWQQRFGGERSVIGRTITLNSNPWNVIGVLPADFRFVSGPFALWAPIVLEVPGQPANHGSHSLQVFGRLKPGVTLDHARDEMARIARGMEAEYPDSNRDHGATVVPMREEFVKPYRASLTVLFAAVGFVLLIACVNVASLLLVRAAARRREMAVRSALGASRARLVMQSLVESLGLSMAGGLAGLGVAALGLRALPAVMPDKIAIVGVADLRLDPRVLAFTFVLTLVTGVVFGLMPALHASTPDVTETLKQGGRGPAGVGRRSRSALVIGEVALATSILVGAALTIRSFGAILAQPLGFQSSSRLTVTVSLPAARYADADARRRTLADLEARLRVLPGVNAAGAIDILPLGGGDSRRGIAIEGRERKTGEAPTRMHPRSVTPGYFQAMAIPLVKGRGFSEGDDERHEPVVVISEAGVRRFWAADANPIGARIQFSDNVWRTVVGISGDVRHWGLLRDVNPIIYLPQAQVVSSALTFVLQTSVEPGSLVPAVRATVRAVDSNLPVVDLDSVDDVVARSVREQRAQMTLMGAFGAVALLLAAIGIYGVMAQLVTTRVHEIGVRMTLGAQRSAILWQFMSECLWQTTAGLAIGMFAGVLLMRAGRDVLFNVKPWDPASLAAAAAVLMLAGLSACLIPARRAMRVDPVEALRQA